VTNCPDSSEFDVLAELADGLGVADFIDAVATARAYVTSNPEAVRGGKVILTVKIMSSLDMPLAERLADADEMAEWIGAVPEWHNGYRRARRVFERGDDDFDLVLELLFIPLILAEDITGMAA
jgi:hypothetical protein